MPAFDPIHDALNTTAQEPQEPQEPQEVQEPQEPQDTTKDTKDTNELQIPETQENKTTSNDSDSEATAEQDHEEQSKPVILRHRLNPKKSKKGARISLLSDHLNSSVLTSARSRHLKKDDGQPFWRKDIQYELLKSLFENDTKAFTDPYPDSKDQVKIDDRSPDPQTGRLSFAELYIKTIAHSSKCSKVLRDRLLNDMKMSIPTCMICLLVNVGRMNTTINFVPDMKSQLRTYHSIPSLQINYDTGSTIDKNDKQLQDTPRLKSILKACSDDSSEPVKLPLQNDSIPKTNIINLIFIMCNDDESINKQYFWDKNYTFFDLFMNQNFNPIERSITFLWLLYNYLETNSTEDEIKSNPFGSSLPTVSSIKSKNDDMEVEFDVDTEEELSFGKLLHEQRLKFLNDPNDSSLAINSSHKRSSDPSYTTQPHKKATTTIKTPSKSNNNTTNKSTTRSAQKSTTTSSSPPLDATNTATATATTSHTSPSTTTPPSPIPPTPTTTSQSSIQLQTPVLRQDIDVVKVRKIIKNFIKKHERRRLSKGLLKHEHSLITKEFLKTLEVEPLPAPGGHANRLRLKNYKGDFVEYNSKFHNLLKCLKTDYNELTKDYVKNLENDVEFDYVGDDDLTLKDFKI